jgi:hypothetical protein
MMLLGIRKPKHRSLTQIIARFASLSKPCICVFELFPILYTDALLNLSSKNCVPVLRNSFALWIFWMINWDRLISSSPAVHLSLIQYSMGSQKIGTVLSRI